MENYLLISQVKQVPHRFWDVLEDRREIFGSLLLIQCLLLQWEIPAYRTGRLSTFYNQGGTCNNRVMSIYEDRAGIIWFGTGGGVSRYDGKSFRNFTTKEGLSNNDILLSLKTKLGNYGLVQGRGLFYDGKHLPFFRNKDGKAFNNVWSIIEDRKGNILVRCRWSLRYDGSTFTKLTQRGVYAIVEDKKGNI